ncbi:hypothetical protein GCM10027614_06170 [Micromonospora vulcania]
MTKTGAPSARRGAPVRRPPRRQITIAARMATRTVWLTNSQATIAPYPGSVPPCGHGFWLLTMCTTTRMVRPQLIVRSPRVTPSLRGVAPIPSMIDGALSSTRQASSTAPVATSSSTIAGEAPTLARAASRLPSRVANAAATCTERSRPTIGAASHWPTALNRCAEVFGTGLRNASNEWPGRAPSAQTIPMAATGTSDSTPRRRPVERPPSQDSQLRWDRQDGVPMHRQAIRSSATPTMERT